MDISSLDIFDRWVIVSGVLNYLSGVATLYLDGIMIGESAVVMEQFGQGTGSALSDAVSIIHDVSIANISGHQISHAQIHDYAMTQPEIAAFK